MIFIPEFSYRATCCGSVFAKPRIIAAGFTNACPVACRPSVQKPCRVRSLRQRCSAVRRASQAHPAFAQALQDAEGPLGRLHHRSYHFHPNHTEFDGHVRCSAGFLGLQSKSNHFNLAHPTAWVDHGNASSARTRHSAQMRHAPHVLHQSQQLRLRD